MEAAALLGAATLARAFTLCFGKVLANSRRAFGLLRKTIAATLWMKVTSFWMARVSAGCADTPR